MAPSSFVVRLNGWLRRVPIWALYVCGALPGLWSFYLALSGGLGPDPVRPLEHDLGLYALQFLVAATAASFVQRGLGLNLQRFRRALGLLAFFYALVHLLVWVALDMQFLWGQMLGDILKRPYLLFGMIAFVLLIPLAWTSRDRAIRAMGILRWRRLHLLVYPAALLAAVHFVMVQKTWQAEPLIYLSTFVALLALRGLRAYRA